MLIASVVTSPIEGGAVGGGARKRENHRKLLPVCADVGKGSLSIARFLMPIVLLQPESAF